MYLVVLVEALDIPIGRSGDQVCIMDGEKVHVSLGGNTAGVERMRAFVLVLYLKQYMESL